MATKARQGGRYNKRISTTNLGEPEFDDPVFVPFTYKKSELRPRTTSESVSVLNVDLLLASNRSNHNTTNYDTQILLVRRGQPLQISIEFSRPVNADEYLLEFRIGDIKTTVYFGTRASSNTWYGVVDDDTTANVLVSITPPANAIVGQYNAVVGLLQNEGIAYAKDLKQPLYMLFNAWCPEDVVYMPNAAEREEYVVNDYGVIYMGTAYSYSGRPWFYNQYDEGILDACIHILDRCRMPISERGNAITVCRQASELINSQDGDNGVVVGNWGDSFANGTSPLQWTGSRNIMKQYMETGLSVRYGQCWVFAGVLNTVLRCLGLPARVITNFNSAHDNDGNVKTDIYYTETGEKDPRTRDSIWNFHCWNEVYMTRPDLPSGLGGWQCVDSTPQETSDGYFRCGPASVAAVKDGHVSYQFDTTFVYAEVNSNVVHYTWDKYNVKTPFKVETNRVGMGVVTKSLGHDGAMDIKNTYKYAEGSAEDTASLANAQNLGLSNDVGQMSPSALSLSIYSNTMVEMGNDVQLVVEFSNQTDQDLYYEGQLVGNVIYYTGFDYKQFLTLEIQLTVPAKTVETMPITVPSQQYLQSLGYHNTLEFQVMGMSDNTRVNSMCVIRLDNLPLNFTLHGIPEQHQDMSVEVSFRNPTNYTLTNVYIALEGSGLFYYIWKHFGDIEAHGTISWNVPFRPWRKGVGHILGLLMSDNLHQVWGVTPVMIQYEDSVSKNKLLTQK